MGLPEPILDQRKSATLPHGRLSLRLQRPDSGDAKSTILLPIGSPISPTNSEAMSVPYAHKNPLHATVAFDSLNKMRQNKEVCNFMDTVTPYVMYQTLYT